MIFPLPSIWFGSPEDDNVARRVDRFEDTKRHRMSVGLYVDHEFATVQGSLLIVSGHGKYIRPCSWSTETVLIPEPLSKRLKAIQSENSPDLLELTSVKSELAVIQSQLVHRIKEMAGKYVERILAIGVVDPGLWMNDFDGQKIYQSLCDPNRLAELTGLNVIDAFPARDLESGGTAQGLSSLPIWLLMADRDQRQATHSRLVIDINRHCEAYFLPGSDGLDADLPEIRHHQVVGAELFRYLSRQFRGPEEPLLDDQTLELVTLNGHQRAPVVQLWQESRKTLGNDPKSYVDIASDVDQEAEHADLLRSCIVFAANQILEISSSPHSELPLNRLLISEQGAFSMLLMNELSNRMADGTPKLTIESSGKSSELQATLAALFGFLTIDQMPISLPWVTGCDTPKVLGQITAGRPANWRHLLIEMADYRPPAMKLKDAI